MNKGGYAYVSPLVNLNLVLLIGGVNLVPVIASGVFLKTSNGCWSIDLYIDVEIDYQGSAKSIGITGVTFKYNTNQPIVCISSSSPAMAYAYNSGIQSGIQIEDTINGTTTTQLKGELQLESKPTAYLPDGV